MKTSGRAGTAALAAMAFLGLGARAPARYLRLTLDRGRSPQADLHLYEVEVWSAAESR